MIQKLKQLIDIKSKQAGDDNPHRRIKDSIESKNNTHTMNLERRLKYNERRKKSSTNYIGPARRFNVDRRMNNEDRRD